MSIEYSATALKQLRRLDPQFSRRILDYMDEVATLPDPHSRGKPLTGDRAGLWRYRVGDYRLLCHLDGTQLRVRVLEVGHRGRVYE